METNRRSFLITGAGAVGAFLLHQSSHPLFATGILRELSSTPERRQAGADIPWTTYPAADMKTSGTLLGPKYDPFLVEIESTRQRCVKLSEPREYVEFTVASPANAIVVRYSLPDSEAGQGVNSALDLYVNGKLLNKIPLTSKYTWRYGDYPFTNDPKAGRPRNFYDEARLKNLKLAKGDVVHLQKAQDDVSYCIIDLVDLENVDPPLRRPKGSLSATDFGATGNGKSDDTEALRRCLAEASKQGKTAWVPAGDYKVTGDLVILAGLAVQGAGMWHTTFVGDDDLYHRPDRRVRFKVSGSNSQLSDFAILGKLTYRNDSEQNDGIFGAHASGCTLSRLWIEHTKVGMWFYVCDHVVVDRCRFRNTLADGINLCVDVRDSVVQNCTARNTGDDCFAIWPTVSDQGFVQNSPTPGNNVFRRLTGQTPFLANGAAIYGGANNLVEDCLFTDIGTGCGILISTTFPTADEKLKVDNNFSGTTVVRNCELVRCGGYDHSWRWRAAFQVCLERRSISGLRISNLRITDSISDGFSIVAPGSKNGQCTLSDTQLDGVEIRDYGVGAPGRHGLWVREDAQGSIAITASKISDIKNGSINFQIIQK